MEIQWPTAWVILPPLPSYVICAMTKNTVRSPPVITCYNPRGLNIVQVLTNTWLSSTRACQRNTSLCCVMGRQQSLLVVRDGRFMLCQPTGDGIHPPPALLPWGSFLLAQTQQILCWPCGRGALEERVVLSPQMTSIWVAVEITVQGLTSMLLSVTDASLM